MRSNQSGSTLDANLDSNPSTDSAELDPLTTFSDRLKTLLRPLKILEAIRWGAEVESDFLAHSGRRLPNVDRSYYNRRELAFDRERQHDGLTQLQAEIVDRFGKNHAAACLLLSRCEQAHVVIELICSRGTSRFHELSCQLFGSSLQPTTAKNPLSLDKLANRWSKNATTALFDTDCEPEQPTLSSTEAARELADRFSKHFEKPVKVLITDELEANAAVSGECLKLRRSARFTLRDVRLLEVHEGWVHLATTRNARSSRLPFLAKPLPTAIQTQEGLAVWTELLTFSSHPLRLRMLAARVEGVTIAERGGDFLDVYHHYLKIGLRPREAYRHTARIYRGSTPQGKPFTKDLAYVLGFARVSQVLMEALKHRKMARILLLFCGKVSVDDLEFLEQLLHDGLIHSPHDVPPPFRDLRGLAAILCTLNGLAGGSLT